MALPELGIDCYVDALPPYAYEQVLARLPAKVAGGQAHQPAAVVHDDNTIAGEEAL